MKRSRLILRLEPLEDRCTPATFSNPWPDARDMTLSFMPDGTQVGSSTSSLFSLLGHTGPTAAWEKQILRAVQTWAAQAEINVGLVADNGAAYGAGGLIQGDDRFGDIRIGAVDLGSSVVAVATPFDPSAGTIAGDILLNSRYVFGTGGNGQYDLYTVMLHEAGHVFGLPDNQDSTSAMYDDYTKPRTGLSSGDVSNLLQLYAPRTVAGDNSFSRATPIVMILQSDGSLQASVDGELAGAGDANFYAFTTPLQLLNTQVGLQTSGISTLVARLTVYDAGGNVVGTATATDPLHGDMTLNLGGLKLLSSYYIEVQGADGSIFAAGSYRLNVDSLPTSVNGLTTGLVGAATGVVTPLVQSLPTNTTFATATVLPSVQQVDSRFAYGFRSVIAGASQARYYEFVAPSGGSASVMTVMAWGLGSQGLLPAVTVYDANQQAVAAQVLVNDSGMVDVQIINPVAGAAYYVKVAAAQPQGNRSTGGFFLGINFSAQPVVLNNWVQGTLSQVTPQLFESLTAPQTALYHFVLSAAAADPSTQAAVRMTIYDGKGKVVFTLMAQNGETVTGNVFLAAGSYTVRIAGGTPNGSPLAPLKFSLRGIVIDDPIGPGTSDPTSDPSQPPPPPPPGQPPPPPSPDKPPPDGSTSDPNNPTWTSDGSQPPPNQSSAVPPQDPYSNPYSPT
jgi:hypothetical protein